MERAETLEHLTFFEAFVASDRERLAAIATRRSFGEGATIFDEGDEPGSIRVLESGLVSLRQKQKDGLGDVQMMIIRDSGSVFGIAALVGEEHVYPHSAVCLEDTELIEIDGERLLALLHAEPEAGVRILLRFAQYISSRLTGAREQIRSRIRPGLISHG